MDSACDRLADWMSSSGGAGGVPTGLTERLQLESAVALFLFLLVAAVETTHTLTMMALRASEEPAASRCGVWELFAEVPPLPYVYYVAERDTTVGTNIIREGSIVGMCLAREPQSRMRLVFGVGPHHCFGARIALAVGAHLLLVLPQQPRRPWEWQRDLLTWRLTYKQ